ncbi:hypothetical protein ATANTOWER_013189 [Ataeniobius toweri]|uniref:Ubiquitin-like domain-containing protein n=1 Tax=Ataeniobius toweri TaxID=208326 RepID=A0ABU7CGT0_9TELE|nr:hypothetical protein [Ataeniobius toweri]
MTIDLCSSKKEMKKITVLELKKKISAKLPGDPEEMLGHMQLIFADKRLDKDHNPLSAHGVMDQSVIHMVILLDGGGMTPLRT